VRHGGKAAWFRLPALVSENSKTTIALSERNPIRRLSIRHGLRLSAPAGRRSQGNMKKIIPALSIAIVMAGLALGQDSTTRSRTTAGNETSVAKQGRQVNLQSGTQIAAQLEHSLDARNAKPGDRVVLKTVSAIKQNGETIVPKGARLIGHVTEVQQQSKSNAESRIGVLFDQLRTGSTETPITASIVSITQARTQARANNDLFESDTMSRSSTSSRTTTSAGGGGGLLGVGNTVGGAVNTTTSTVGNVAGTTTNAVGSTVGATTSTVGSSTGNLSGSLRGLQITQSTSASAEGGSTLSLSGRNLHLDSGTTFNLAVSSSASAGNNP